MPRKQPVWLVKNGQLNGQSLAKMVEVNQAENLVNGMPGLKQVEGWIDQAKKLPRVVTY